MCVYLIHFTEKFHHARHYVGYTDDLARRITEHQRERLHLFGAINKAGIPWLVARVWQDGDRALERKLKNWKGSAQFCPVCRAEAGKSSTAILPASYEERLSPSGWTQGALPAVPHAGDGKSDPIFVS